MTATHSPAHLDYPVTKVRVGDLLARVFWPYMARESDPDYRDAIYKSAFSPTSRAVDDPFYARKVQLSNDIVDRLRGRFAIGPHLPNGDPEFGWRQFQTTPINHEAADVILEQRRMIELLTRQVTHLTEELTASEAKVEDLRHQVEQNFAF